ncbi:MAG: Septum site-determining protein MinD [Pelotomaculum sp. PtaU1.Bin065]|nr:MAG: Septum site-determining protein MinD [Pelotomaculum sp. PtaU1.Bin065]
MRCLIAAEKEIAPVIRDNLNGCGLYPGWEFDICENAGDLTTWSRENFDVLILSRFLPGEDPLSLLGMLRTFFPSTHIVLLAGKESEQRRHYIKAAHKYGLDNIVTGKKLPGERPYNIFAALTSARTETFLEWEDEDTVSEENTPNEIHNQADLTPASLVSEVVDMPQPCRTMNQNNPDSAIVVELRSSEISTASQMASSTSGGIMTSIHAQDTDTPIRRGFIRKPGEKKNVFAGSKMGGVDETTVAQEISHDRTFTRTGREPKGKIILVTANKGGVGKTTVGVALAINLTRAGVKACLADFDLAGPNVAAFFNIKNGTGLEVISRRNDLQRVLLDITVKVEENLFVLPGIMDKTLPAISPDLILETVEILAEEYDVVICDTPPGFWEKDWLLDVFPRADMIMSVVDQSKFSEVETRDYAPKLIMMGVDPSRIRIVCNRFNPKLDNVKKVEAFYNAGLKKSKVLPRVIVTIPENWESFVKNGYKADIPGINDPLSPWRRLSDEVGKTFSFNLRHLEKPQKKKGLFGGFKWR